ncbi:MAG TPA: ABC transporter permease [Acidobacteriaceae bacterium]
MLDFLRQAAQRVMSFFHKESMDRELDAEMTAHLEFAIQENVQRGMNEGEARRQALAEFGGVQQARERQREARGLPFLDVLVQDARFALRQLERKPGFAATAVLVLALGIGASTAIFGFVNAALIDPLPYAQPNQLLDVGERSAVFPRSDLSRQDFEDWQRMNTTLSSLEGYVGNGYLLRIGNVSTPVPGARVSPGFFRTLGVQPILGRDFRPGEDEERKADVAMLTWSGWMERFGGRKDVIGQTISLSGDPYTIVGVLPKDFAFAPRANAELWTPLGKGEGCEARRSCHDLFAVGRLKEGVTPGQAQADLQRIAARLEAEYPGSNKGQGASAQPLRDEIVGQVEPILLTLLAGSGLLLIIACVNVASLLLVRSESRRREIAVRGALGATRLRLGRQFVTEGLLLAAAGGVAGLLTAGGLMALLRKLVPKAMADGVTFLGGVGMNAHTALFAVAIVMLAATLLAVTPMIHLAFAELHESLSEGGRGAAGRFWRRMGANLVVVELTVAVVLLAGAGLLGKSLYRLLHVDVGFDSTHVAAVNVMAPDTAYPKPQQWVELYGVIRQRLMTLPGVEAVGFTSDLPVQCDCDTDWIRIAGKPFRGEHNEVLERDANPEYLGAVLRAKLLRGRLFTDADDMQHPQVTVINETLAKKYFPGEDPLGKMIGQGDLDPKSMRQVVGVIADVREGALDDPAWPAEYLSIYHGPDNYFSVAVRTRGEEKALLPEMVKMVRGIDPRLGVYGEITMTDQIGSSITAMIHRFSTWLVGGFAVAALLLGVIGLYGVIAYSVSQRTREIGVRMALGAQRGAVHALILKEAAWLTGLGVVIGLAGSIGTASAMGKLLFGVRSWDAETLGCVAGALVLAALLASYIPARRAAAVNPMDALRAE